MNKYCLVTLPNGDVERHENTGDARILDSGALFIELPPTATIIYSPVGYVNVVTVVDDE